MFLTICQQIPCYPRAIHRVPSGQNTGKAQSSSLFQADSAFFTLDEALTADLISRICGPLRHVTSGDTMFFTAPNLGTGSRGGQSVVMVGLDELEVSKGLLQEDLMHRYQLPDN